MTHCVKRSFLPTHVTISVDDCSFLKCNSQFLGELYQPIGKEDVYKRQGQMYVTKTCIDDFKYHEDSEKMRNEIRKTVTKIAIKATCNLLCELTEISDTRWQNEECKINGTSF